LFPFRIGCVLSLFYPFKPLLLSRLAPARGSFQAFNYRLFQDLHRPADVRRRLTSCDGLAKSPMFADSLLFQGARLLSDALTISAG